MPDCMMDGEIIRYRETQLIKSILITIKRNLTLYPPSDAAQKQKKIF